MSPQRKLVIWRHNTASPEGLQNYRQHVTQSDRRQARDNDILDSMTREHRNPSKHRLEEHDMLNWLKANRKQANAGKMKPERAELFEKLLEMGEKLRRVNQWGERGVHIISIFEDESEPDP